MKFTKKQYDDFCKEMKQDSRDEGITYEMNVEMIEDTLNTNTDQEDHMSAAINYLKEIGVRDISGRLADDITY